MWEPRVKRVEDEFEDELDLVDHWKTAKFQTFEEFWKQDKVGVGLLGADAEGLCMFKALTREAELAGCPDITTQQDIGQSVHDELVFYNHNLVKGTTWKIVLRFLRRHRDTGRDFDYTEIAKTNYAVPGRRGTRVFEEIELSDGVYVVAAYNHSPIEHGFVLTVQGKKRLIYDLQEGKPIASAQGWINYAFVRPFIVFK
ncbi:uncharacterized protein IUM83_09263 [Phytophthora cinnamomi]|uniref:uncharacterized protein n=1 Tax=Phytophthora cinnamomi TaxID=4785 RepID=UPI00355A8E83|nr:hypothetical protein IUM83_09263 [Phytophthora cinnamomi]